MPEQSSIAASESARPRKKVQYSSLSRFLSLLKPERATFLLALVALAGGSAVNLAFPEVLRQLLSPAYWDWVRTNPWSCAALLIALFGLQGVFFYLRSYLFGLIGQRIVAGTRKRLFSTVLEQPLEFLDARAVSDVVSRISTDVQLLQEAVSIKLSVLLRYGLQVLGGTALMLYLSVRLSIAILLAVPILVVFSIFLGKRLKAHSRAQQTEVAAATLVAHEALSNIRVVKAFAAESFEETRFSRANGRALQQGIARTRISAFFQSFVSFLMNSCIVLVLLYGMTLVAAGSLSLGDLTAFLLYGLIVAVSFAFLAGGYSELVQALGVSDRVFELLDQARPASPVGSVRKVDFSGPIELRQVSFSYASRPDQLVLNQLSCSIPAGARVALVGPSGAGKSTLSSLLLGLYAPTKGEVTFSGVPIATIDTQALRSAVALVPQEVQLFAGSIFDNIHYARTSASPEEVQDAARRALVSEFCDRFPQGLETLIGERGQQLSGGQRQRIAIARALLRNPKLLVLDEATSALDSTTEHQVQIALRTLMQGRTCVIIAHRLSTVKDCDLVLVIDRGTIVQSGSYEALSRSPGLFRDMVVRQELTDGMSTQVDSQVEARA
jgi:ABC-type multidrug transport system fused ATPase/permease subunit